MSKLKQFLPQKQSFLSVVRPRKSQSEKNDYLLLSSQSDEEDNKLKINIFKSKSDKKKKFSLKKTKNQNIEKNDEENCEIKIKVENHENKYDVNKNYENEFNQTLNENKINEKKINENKINENKINEKKINENKTSKFKKIINCKIKKEDENDDEMELKKKDKKIIYENFNQDVYSYVNETNSNFNDPNKLDKLIKIPKNLIKKIETTYTEIPINNKKIDNLNSVENRRRKNNQSFDTLFDRIEFINSKSKIKNEKKLERNNNHKSENNLLHRIPPVPRSMKVLKNEELNLLSKIEVSQNEFSRKIFSNQKLYSRNPIYVSMYELNEESSSKNLKPFNNLMKNSINKSTKTLNETNFNDEPSYLVPRQNKLKVMNYQDKSENNLKSLRELKPKQLNQVNDEKLSQLTYTYLDFDNDKNLENNKKVNSTLNSEKQIQYSKIDFLASNSLKKVKEFRSKNRYFQE